MIRCASVSYYFGPYASNYILAELRLHERFRIEGQYYLSVFPKAVEHYEWVSLFKEKKYNVIFLEDKPLSLKCVFSLRRIFKQNRINLIYVHFGGWDIPAKFAAPFTTTIWHQRMSVNLDTPKRRFYHSVMYKIIGRYNTQHIAISNAVFQAIKSLTSNKTYYIPDGIDFSRIANGVNLKPTEKCKPYKVLLFAFSAIGKGLDIAIKACNQLNQDEQIVELQVVTQQDSNEYLSKHYTSIPNWLKVLPPTSNVNEYYKEADIFLSASRSEGFCNALLEAIYCGLPAIYSDIPGTKWAEEFQNTFQYAVESSDGLAKAVMQCVSTDVSELQLSQNRELAEKLYSIQQWENAVYSVLTKCNL